MTKLFHQIKKLIKYVKELASKHGIPYQSDMFGGGGTDAGNAHLEKRWTFGTCFRNTT